MSRTTNAPPPDPAAGAGYYGVIPATVMHDKRLSFLARLLFGEVWMRSFSKYAQERGGGFASNSTLAEAIGVHPVTISSAMQELKRGGYIQCKGRGRGRRYRPIINDRGEPITEAEAATIQPEGEKAFSPQAKNVFSPEAKHKESSSKERSSKESVCYTSPSRPEQPSTHPPRDRISDRRKIESAPPESPNGGGVPRARSHPQGISGELNAETRLNAGKVAPSIDLDAFWRYFVDKCGARGYRYPDPGAEFINWAADEEHKPISKYRRNTSTTQPSAEAHLIGRSYQADQYHPAPTTLSAPAGGYYVEQEIERPRQSADAPARAMKEILGEVWG